MEGDGYKDLAVFTLPMVLIGPFAVTVFVLIHVQPDPPGLKKAGDNGGFARTLKNAQSVQSAVVWLGICRWYNIQCFVGARSQGSSNLIYIFGVRGRQDSHFYPSDRWLMFHLVRLYSCFEGQINLNWSVRSPKFPKQIPSQFPPAFLIVSGCWRGICSDSRGSAPPGILFSSSVWSDVGPLFYDLYYRRLLFTFLILLHIKYHMIWHNFKYDIVYRLYNSIWYNYIIHIISLM